MSVHNNIKLKRYTSETLPSSLPLGFPVFCTDTGEFYVGMGEERQIKQVRDIATLKYLTEEISKLVLDFDGKINSLDEKFTRQLTILEKRVTNIELNGGVSPSVRETVTPYRFVESFTSTGDNVFVLSKGLYEPNLERLEVFVGGVFQVSGRNYEETNTSTITFTEQIPQGVIVDVVVYTKSVSVLNHEHPTLLGREEKAIDSSKLDSYSQDYKATPNTIVRRDGYGDIYTRSGLVVQDPSLGNVAVFGTSTTSDNKIMPRFKDCISNISGDMWCSLNLPVEQGEWTPTAYGSNQGIITPSSCGGSYYRVGKLIFISGYFNADSRQGATGEFRIGGIPFVHRGQTTNVSFGYVRGIKLGSEYQLSGDISARSQYIRFVASNVNSDTVGGFVVNAGSHMNGTIEISFTAMLKLE